MGLPVVNASRGRQYRLVCPIKYSTSHGLVVIFNSFLTERGEIIRTTTERGGKVLFITDFHRLDRAPDKVIDWRCTNSKLKYKARIIIDDEQGARDNT